MEGESQNLPETQGTPEPPAEEANRRVLQGEVVQPEDAPLADDERLTEARRKRLDELEGEIESGVDRWLAVGVEIGRKLMEIHDRGLYIVEDYGTFENYCQRRWEIGRAQGNRLVDYARVADAVSPTGDILIPASERQAREIAPLARKDPPAARRVWEKLLEDNGGRPRSYAQQDLRSAGI